MENILTIKNITKSFGGNVVIKDISLDIGMGRFVTLLGPSGCGKTTTLRIISGLESPDSGSVILSGNDVTALPPDKRSVNTVFQNYALFPHLNVYKNIAYGLKIKKYTKREIAEKIAAILDIVELCGFESRMPDELSGGQRQRVAIARALVLDPQVLLLDEPLGALDLQLRRQMQRELKAIQLKTGITFVYITHDQEEAMSMSDDIIIMNGGKIIQKGTPREIYEHPKTRFAASFIGESNIIDGQVVANKSGCYFRAGSAKIPVEAQPAECAALSVRPADVHIADAAPDGFFIPATVKSVQYTGSFARVTASAACGDITAEISGRMSDGIKSGANCFVYWNPAHSAVITEETDL